MRKSWRMTEGRNGADPYASIAPLYDPVTAAFLRGPRRALVQECLRLGVRRVLDIGCGTGVLPLMLAEALSRLPVNGAAPLVAGVDSSTAMLRAAREKGRQAAQTGGGRCRPVLVRADAAGLVFQPRAFDLAVLALVLHESPAGPDVLLQNALVAAPMALVLEWRMPERNLDCLGRLWVPVVERLAGKGHYASYRRYMRGGALHGLVNRVGASVVREKAMALGSLVLALVQR